MLTVEPGYYEPGKYGIRIEILYEIIASDKPGFLTMAPQAFIPIQKTMIDVSMLTDKERQWVDDYHSATRAKVSQLLDDTETIQWLEDATAPLTD